MISDEETPTFFQRYRVIIIAVGVLALAVGGWVVFGPKEGKKRKSTASVMSIMPPLPPPPPPPTPPPPTPPPPQEPPPEQTKQPEFQPEEKPAPEPPQPPDNPPPAMGTALQGDGPNSFGLSGTGNGMIGGRGNGKGGGGGTKYGWYAGQVQARVLEAMQRHRKLRSSALTVQVRIWADSNGRVTRAKVSGTSGDAAIDQALEREVLAGLQLSQPPPDGMPMPIVMRITARRPN